MMFFFLFLSKTNKVKMGSLAQCWIPTGFVLKYYACSDRVPLRSICAANGQPSKRHLMYLTPSFSSKTQKDNTNSSVYYSSSSP